MIEIKSCIEVVQADEAFKKDSVEFYEAEIFKQVKEKLLAYQKKHLEVFSFQVNTKGANQ